MIVGMHTYLSMSSCPDIALAVHQCARFSTCPMRVHEIAICHICRYLQATSTKGLILHPTLHHLEIIEIYIPPPQDRYHPPLGYQFPWRYLDA